MALPEKDCIDAPYQNMSRCGEHEFACGDGKCIHGLAVCDNSYDCVNGADELMW